MNYFKEIFTSYGMSENASIYFSTIVLILIIALICIIANLVTEKIVLRLITHIINNNKFKWGHSFLKHKVFQKLSHIVPAIIIYSFASAFPHYEIWIERLVLFYIFAIVISVLYAFLNSVNDIYMSFDISKTRPIKGYLQVLKIIIFIFGSITQISILIEKNPLLLLSGLGALSAVLMLIFKDSILGLVAGVQLTANDMVRVGDWIEMPKYNADGDVIDITLNTVKVQNWDNTITMIPSYALVSDSFKNWRGMQDSGGRRIKRSIYIDTTSIKFCDNEMLEYFKKIHYLSQYIENKEIEIEMYNKENNIIADTKVNGRHLTNIGVFRIYIQNYLLKHPHVHKNLTIMVRQLAPTETGIPLEIYCFVNDIRWINYEAIQSDIFDHIFSVASEFDIRIFQNPSGYDFSNLYNRQQNQ